MKERRIMTLVCIASRQDSPITDLMYARQTIDDVLNRERLSSWSPGLHRFLSDVWLLHNWDPHSDREGLTALCYSIYIMQRSIHRGRLPHVPLDLGQSITSLLAHNPRRVVYTAQRFKKEAEKMPGVIGGYGLISQKAQELNRPYPLYVASAVYVMLFRAHYHC